MGTPQEIKDHALENLEAIKEATEKGFVFFSKRNFNMIASDAKQYLADLKGSKKKSK
ncbi:MAG: hypothetical protein V4506_19185 [Bacteroidota bacterium]